MWCFLEGVFGGKNMDSKGKCFVIMPISDPNGYEDGHFKMIYEDVFCPAIEQAGYTPFRADDSFASNLIQEKIVREIIESPMALCDLSTRNPNVLFELGIRQAFDLPVVLVQEEGTERIFDIGNINTLNYDKNMQYRKIVEAQENIKSAIIETENPTNGVNSIIKLLQVSKAQMPDQPNMTELDEIKMLINSMRNEVEAIRNEVKIQERIQTVWYDDKPYGRESQDIYRDKNTRTIVLEKRNLEDNKYSNRGKINLTKVKNNKDLEQKVIIEK